MSKTQETVTACPECDKPHLRERETMSPTWLCKRCRAEFDDPVKRDRRRHGEAHPDAMYGHGTYKELKLALWRTLDAGTRHADSRIIAKYTAELTRNQIGKLLTGWAVDDDLVSVWSDSGNRTRFRIEIDGGVDDG